MLIDMVGLVSACSYALDCIEAELVNVTNRHGKRVAYISVCMAEKMGIEGAALQDLAICAMLHDNALTQYICEEINGKIDMPYDNAGNYKASVIKEVSEAVHKRLGIHCTFGEENIKKLPFNTDVSGVILYHHENADGTGPFGKKWDEVPLFARIIHLCDMVDVIGKSCNFSGESWSKAQKFVSQNRNTLFDSKCADAFIEVFSEENFTGMSQDTFEEEMWKKIPRDKLSCDFQTCRNIADFFARIIDYKSEFTGKHSIGVAKKAAILAEYMGYSKETVEKMYMAGALHDIGKMTVGNDILEKTDKLTDDEYDRMKNHAGYTYVILSQVEDFEDIRNWAALHHEKLDGTGYPFGRAGRELNEPERLMACVDIYQALTEARPYKSGMSHERACGILEDMARSGWIDMRIIEHIEKCFAK